MKITNLLIAASFAMMSTILVVSPVKADYLPGDRTQAEQVDGFEMMFAYLSTETFIPSRIEFRRLSADPVADLIRMAERRSYQDVLRARAIQSLALYNDEPRAISAIDSLMESTRPGQRLYPAVIVAWGGIHGEAAAERLSELARHSRADVRMAAVVALGRFGGQSGYETLIQLADTEEDATVLGRIQGFVR